MAELIIFSGKLMGQRLILPDREVVVGRDEDCHMRIASSLISRKHCALRGSSTGIWVRDLESQNGTYVNDVAISEPFLMQPGDVLRVGAALFQVPRVKPERTPPDHGGLSDDDISTWLAEDEPTATSALPDTTVIKGRQASAPIPAEPLHNPTAAKPIHEPRPAPTLRQPKTVKEQAAEIIRHHWERVRSQQIE